MRYLFVGALLTVAGCTQASPETTPVGMPNPASVYCQQQGGRLEIREGPSGQTGYCHLPDGRIVEEWELFRTRHNG